MNTTNLFVELMVIGAGTALSGLVMVMAIFGEESPVFSYTTTFQILVPLAALTYVLGIVADRVADSLFGIAWSATLRGKFFESNDAYHEARSLVLDQSEGIAGLIAYGRSRMRICRGWALNSVLMMISANAYAWAQVGDRDLAWKICLVATTMLALLLAGTLFAWYRLSRTGYLRLRQNAEFIRRERAR